jgi:transcriptional regulator with XRE-family HTH domain
MTQQPHSVGVVPDINTLPIRLRAAREHAGLDQGELAERAGVARGTLGAAERGQRTPNNATLTLIAWACGVDAHWLRTGKAPSPDDDGAGGLPRLDLNQQPFDYADAQVTARSRLSLARTAA